MKNLTCKVQIFQSANSLSMLILFSVSLPRERKVKNAHVVKHNDHLTLLPFHKKLIATYPCHIFHIFFKGHHNSVFTFHTHFFNTLHSFHGAFEIFRDHFYKFW